MRQHVQWLTDFGDQAIILPVGLAVLMLLLISRCWRGGLCWFLALGGVLTTMLVLKLAVGACGWVFGLTTLQSPSGHTASATMVYGGLVTLLAPRLRIFTCLLVFCVIAVIFAASRLILHDHTLAEVAVGGTVGIAGVLCFRIALGPVERRPNRVILAALVLVVMVLAHGTRLQAEQDIHAVAITRLRAMLCPMPIGVATGADAAPAPSGGA